MAHKERGDKTWREKDLVNSDSTDQGLDRSGESDVLIKELVPIVKDRSCKPGAKYYHSSRSSLVPDRCRGPFINEELGYQVASSEQRPYNTNTKTRRHQSRGGVVNYFLWCLKKYNEDKPILGRRAHPIKLRGLGLIHTLTGGQCLSGYWVIGQSTRIQS